MGFYCNVVKIVFWGFELDFFLCSASRPSTMFCEHSADPVAAGNLLATQATSGLSWRSPIQGVSSFLV